MKKLLLLAVFTSPLLLCAQVTPPKDIPKVVSAEEAKETKPKYEMMNFWFVMLVKGANRSHDKETAAKLQAGHMANMEKMHEAGKLLLAGPFTDDGNWRGLFVIKADTKEEVEALLKKDPAIAAGRLAYELHPWMTAKNCILK